MNASILHSFCFLLLLMTFCQNLESCDATKEVQPFQKSCGEAVDCGTNHVIAIADVTQDKMSRTAAKNKCNGQRKCQIFQKYDKCSISYYCIDGDATKEVRPFQKSCGEAVDCGTNHVIEIADVTQDKMSRTAAKNKCNGQQKCQIFQKYDKCSISYYCIDDRFIQNCSLRESAVNIKNSTDLFWCYNSTKKLGKNPTCWHFEENVHHHWIILRGVMMIYQESSSYKTPMKTFKTIKSDNKSKVCTSSKYIWIIYLGTKSSETVVNIYSKTDPTKAESDKITKVEKNDPNGDTIEYEEMNNSTKDSESNLFDEYSKRETNNNDKKNVLGFLKIIIIISVIGGVLIVLAMTIAILWCCCRRCNKVTITVPAVDARKDSCYVNDYQDGNDPEQCVKDVEVKVEDTNCQIREGFIATFDAKRETCDSVDFWTDDEDYEPGNDRHSKMKPYIYAIGHCIYERKSSRNEIYMNSVIPPPPQFEKDQNAYINMNSNPTKHFNVFL